MSSPTSTNIYTLLTAMQTVFAKHSTDEQTTSQEINRVLNKLSKQSSISEMGQVSRHAITKHIGVVLRHGSKLTTPQPLLEAIAPVAHFLPWRHIDGDSNTSFRSSRQAAMADIVGPIAPLRSNIVSLGLILIAPNTLCPSHYHSDAEFAHVVTGSATWIINGVPQKHQSGTFLVTPSQAVHAIHTEYEPLLAINMRKLILASPTLEPEADCPF